VYLKDISNLTGHNDPQHAMQFDRGVYLREYINL